MLMKNKNIIGKEGENVTGADNQQERLLNEKNPQRLHAKNYQLIVKIQSDPHSDMWRLSEMLILF